VSLCVSTHSLELREREAATELYARRNAVRVVRIVTRSNLNRACHINRDQRCSHRVYPTHARIPSRFFVWIIGVLRAPSSFNEFAKKNSYCFCSGRFVSLLETERCLFVDTNIILRRRKLCTTTRRSLFIVKYRTDDNIIRTRNYTEVIVGT